jgi:tetratricopeptide (TPR) repeat protein
MVLFDDLTAWLVGLLADAGRRRLTTVVLGSDQERALRRAATAAVQLTAHELRPDDDEQAEHLVVVISEVFTDAPLDAHETETVLEALQVGIAGQLAVLDDASMTETGQSSADVLEVSGTVLADKLTTHLVRQIVVRGARGSPLAPLANQLNHDVTHVLVRRVAGAVDRRADEVMEELARLGTTRAVTAAPVAPAQLPRIVAVFTGRDDEMALLANLLDPAGTSGPTVVSAVAGLAGVGKTTLAVQAGHAAMRRGWFGGGVLFIDLHGYDEQQVQPAQALDAALRALGVAAEHIPPGAEDRAALYRSVLAEKNELLLVLDNASSEAQVLPLLPGTGSHKVLITSRHTLAGLGARLVDVTVLDEQAAVGLLDAALSAGRPEDNRITTCPQAATRLASACGGLPLALQITAAMLKADPGLSVAELAEELGGERERLGKLRYQDGSGVSGWSVEAAFELSYRRLDDASARVFRLLPVNPGPDISTTAAAALACLPVGEVRGVLAGLARAHLVEAAPGASGHWRMHDLVRLYAHRLSGEHAEADGREQSRDRLLSYYLTMAEAADAHMQALPGMTVPEEFTSRQSALDWLDAERASLVAGVRMAADTGREQAALRLPLALAQYLNWRRRFGDWTTTLEISVEAARRLGDRHREGVALKSLGEALRQMRRFEEAVTACQEAATIFRETRDRPREGMAINNLSNALQEVQRFGEAITALQEAIAIFRETGYRQVEAGALSNLGDALRQVRRSEEAITRCQEAVVIFRDIRDRYGEGMALDSLANALRQAERSEEAITTCQEAIAVFRDIGNRYGEGTALASLANALRQAERSEEAITALQEAIEIFRETGDQDRERIALIFWEELVAAGVDETVRAR